jgi:hypothetical protein
MFTPLPLTQVSLILSHTPVWVWVLFAALIVLGSKQMLDNRVGLRRVIVLPLAMLGLSLSGTLSAFGATPAALLAWGAGFTVTAALMLQYPAPKGVSFDPASRQFTVPGSFVPLALMMGIFAFKYTAGVALAMHPELRHDAMLTIIAGTAYGAFSGAFAARAGRLLRLALQYRGLRGLMGGRARNTLVA